MRYLSMDGKRRAIDNIYIERFWMTIKRDYVYLNPCENGIELYQVWYITIQLKRTRELTGKRLKVFI